MSATMIKMVLALLLVTLVRSEWCIANYTCPDPVLQHGLDWACANGADCDKTLPGQPCFLPNSLKDHASYAYNSYYKKFKTQGATCNFAYSGILTNVDPTRRICSNKSNLSLRALPLMGNKMCALCYMNFVP
ncbi:hypothetical protein PVL29_012609 [Vitis rotundifolia]|uniref:X8 domain-containing protein n=1 Tax=Vitis rotundifolia TaxID=103349 RepID=A0AA38ZJE3_VITRO|nr:hypothetical protein PVL29_012609 [Vitis rotundifolia]